MSYRDQYRYWCEDDYFDDQTKAEHAATKENEAEIEERF